MYRQKTLRLPLTERTHRIRQIPRELGLGEVRRGTIPPQQRQHLPYRRARARFRLNGSGPIHGQSDTSQDYDRQSADVSLPFHSNASVGPSHARTTQ